MNSDLAERPVATADDAVRTFVTLTIGEQICGVPVLGVRDILSEQAITRIPLATKEIAGSLNLRGRIVTAIDMRLRLNLPPAPEGNARMSVVAEQNGELYALLVDQVSEVMTLHDRDFEQNPPTLPAIWAAHSKGVYRLDGKLLVVLDVASLLALGEAA
jgi:purine-binding chemotaxis protein CheW